MLSVLLVYQSYFSILINISYENTVIHTSLSFYLRFPHHLTLALDLFVDACQSVFAVRPAVNEDRKYFNLLSSTYSHYCWSPLIPSSHLFPSDSHTTTKPFLNTRNHSFYPG